MIHRATDLSRSAPLVGEHWILYLRPPGSQVDSGQLSLYYAAYSPQVGERWPISTFPAPRA